MLQVGTLYILELKPEILLVFAGYMFYICTDVVKSSSNVYFLAKCMVCRLMLSYSSLSWVAVVIFFVLVLSSVIIWWMKSHCTLLRLSPMHVMYCEWDPVCLVLFQKRNCYRPFTLDQVQSISYQLCQAISCKSLLLYGIWSEVVSLFRVQLA